MKRRILTIILLCVGVLGLLLPWKYTLFENEYYSITQSPAGGTFHLYIYEELREIPWDCVLSGVDGQSMDEVVEELLSGDVNGNELAFVSFAPEMEFPGMDRLYVAKLPAGYSASRMIFWNVREYTCSFKNKEHNASGTIYICVNPEACSRCRNFDEQYKELADEGAAQCYRLINGAKVIREGNRIQLMNTDSGATVHLNMRCNGEPVSDLSLLGFGAKRYISTHPKVLMIYAIDIGHGLGAVSLLAGVGLLVYSLLQRKKKAAEQES
jgi:hypothetical protein